ncbi:MAG: hypothetical protein ACRENN_07635 [Candidatus Eiseniibacteriota bacterium]
MAGSSERKPDTEIIGRSGGMDVRAPRTPSAEDVARAASPVPPVPSESRPGGIRRFLAESGVVVAMILACFTIFILLLSLAFPAGHNLGDLLRSRSSTSESVASAPEQGSEAAATSPTSQIATLSVLHTPVHSRTSGSIAWSTARSGLGLRTGDGIQTGSQGSAQVNFERGTLHIDSNSLVILGGGTDVSDLLASTPRALTFVRGDLSARLERNATGPLTVLLPHGVAKLRSTAPSSAAELRITSAADRSSAIAVLSGSVALESNGKTVNVQARQYSRIAEDGAPSEPLPIPKAPEGLTPTANARFAYLDLPPLVMFRWKASGGRGDYRLRATVGPRFQTEVVSEATADTFLNWGRFKPGVYEWRVAHVVNGVEGVPSAPRRLTVEEGGGPMALTVETLPKRVQTSSLDVRGKARPGATVYVMGQAVRVASDGSFEVAIHLPAGASVVLVEAVDAAGNSTYSSQVVYSEN